MQIKIWSAINGQCPVTLLGHKKAITDISIVDRGRNIISVGKDGMCKLWSCGKQKCIEDIFDIAAEDDHGDNLAINACKIRSISGFDLGVRDSPPCEDAVGTEDKLLLVGTESAFVYAIGVHSKRMLFKVKCESAVNCVTFCKESSFAYGTQSGKFYEHDFRNLAQGAKCWHFSKSPIYCILDIKQPLNGLMASFQDGTVIFVPISDLDLQSPGTTPSLTIVHLTGSDIDPIYDLSFDGNFIFTSSRDGQVRKYLLNFAFE